MLITALVLASSALLLRNLDDPYITLWDEAVHVNVVRNLVVDCCTPQLHREPVGSTPYDWTDNHVWLHKPPLPFFFNAVVARLLGVDVFGVRAAAYLLAQGLVVLVFWIGVTRFGTWIALVAATLVAFNHYTFQLVQGHQFSGVPDLALACALMGVLYLALSIVEAPRRHLYVGFGLLCGLAFLCKDGLGLLPFAVLALLPVPVGWRQHAAGVGLALAAAAVIVLPTSLYIAYRFPVEAVFEQQHRVAHLIRDIEGWKRPADYYLTVFFPRVTSPLIVGIAYLAVGYGIIARRRRPSLAVLSLWIATYLVILSFGVSKISNFIYPVMAATYLLLPAVAADLWRTDRQRFVLAGAMTVITSAVLFQWDLLGSSSWVADFPFPQARPALLVFQLSIFAAVAGAAGRARVRQARSAAIAAVMVATALVLAASVRASIAASTARPRDYGRQLALRDAARSAQSVIHPGDVVLVDWPGVRKAHLYVMFWSGSDSFEVTTTSPLSSRLNQVPADRRVFLLSESPISSPVAAIQVDGAILSRLK